MEVSTYNKNRKANTLMCGYFGFLGFFLWNITLYSCINNCVMLEEPWLNNRLSLRKSLTSSGV